MRVSNVNESLRSSDTSAGGGGSTPASGSETSLRLRSLGEKTSTRNNATNGNDGRRLVARMLFVGSSTATTCAMIAEQQAAEERHEDVRERGEHRGRDRGHDERRVVDLRHLRQRGRDEHAGHAREQARHHPRGRAHAVGVDAGELGHARALDDRAHAQPERRVAEEHQQPEHDRDRHRLRSRCRPG